MLASMVEPARPTPTPSPAPTRHRSIPIAAAAGQPASAASGCDGAEAFALRVLGPSMHPAFEHGDIVVIEPGGLARDGAFVLLELPDEGWVLRQLQWRSGGLDASTPEGDPPGWWVAVLDGSSPPRPLPDLTALAGVVIQRVQPGRRARTQWLVTPGD